MFPEGSQFWACRYALSDDLFCFLYWSMIFMFDTGFSVYLRF